MYTAEIVMNGVEADSMAKVINVLGKGICQPCKPPHGHSHCEILTLDVTGRNITRIRLPIYNGCGCPDALGWTVVRFRLRRNSIQFNQGCIVNLGTERTFYGFQICAMSVSSQLDSVSESTRKILHELIGASGVPRTHEIRNNQLCVGVNCNPSPNIPVPELAPFIGGYILLFCIAELPDFITLNPARFNPANSVIVKLRTRRSNTFQEAEDCSLGYSGHTAGSADGISFHEGGNYGNLLGERQLVHEQQYA